MKAFFKYFILFFFLWAVLCFIFKRENAYIDGYNEYGFPLVFFRQFFGKCSDCKPLGFILGNFLFDMFFLAAISLSVLSIKRITKKNNK